MHWGDEDEKYRPPGEVDSGKHEKPTKPKYVPRHAKSKVPRLLKRRKKDK